MFFHESDLQYEVRVEQPDPAFANALQQAIGAIEGEIRVMMQYMFQGFSARGPAKYRDMLNEQFEDGSAKGIVDKAKDALT